MEEGKVKATKVRKLRLELKLGKVGVNRKIFCKGTMLGPKF